VLSSPSSCEMMLSSGVVGLVIPMPMPVCARFVWSFVKKSTAKSTTSPGCSSKYAIENSSSTSRRLSGTLTFCFDMLLLFLMNSLLHLIDYRFLLLLLMLVHLFIVRYAARRRKESVLLLFFCVVNFHWWMDEWTTADTLSAKTFFDKRKRERESNNNNIFTSFNSWEKSERTRIRYHFNITPFFPLNLFSNKTHTQSKLVSRCCCFHEGQFHAHNF
jgi:hypothetical protein